MRRRHNKKSATGGPKKKINVFLDLDNTLIWSLDLEKISKDPPKWMKKFKYIDMPKEYRIFQRPGLQKFLNWLFKNFNVSIWSAASPAYVEFIAKNIVENDDRQLEHVLNSENCEESQHKYGDDNIKNLELLWDIHDLPIGPGNTLIIDDLKKVIRGNHNNSIRIQKFVAKEDSIGDSELKRVKKELQKIKKHYQKHINDPGSFELVNFE
jgi:hypothetical protein